MRCPECKSDKIIVGSHAAACTKCKTRLEITPKTRDLPDEPRFYTEEQMVDMLDKAFDNGADYIVEQTSDWLAEIGHPELSHRLLEGEWSP